MSKGHLYAPLSWVKKKFSEIWDAINEQNSDKPIGYDGGFIHLIDIVPVGGTYTFETDGFVIITVANQESALHNSIYVRIGECDFGSVVTQPYQHTSLSIPVFKGMTLTRMTENGTITFTKYKYR